ncbi:MAG: 2'-5' RNA ligase family protein [Chloroflexales bacterium]|nr:2'-5' RNA ligase family protein [Chloroflexales bacterium]
MYGVVSLLDDQHYQLVEEIWTELDAQFGVRGTRTTPYPHFSYHVAERYDIELLENVVREFAQRNAPFSVKTSGLGMFAGIQPVLYVPIVRSPEFSDFHRALWAEVSAYGVGIVDHYAPEQWLPHITLAQHDIDPRMLPALVRQLNARDFSWEIRVDNLAIIHNTDDPQAPVTRFPLGATL